MKTILLLAFLSLSPLAQASTERTSEPSQRYLLSCTNNPDGTLNCKNLETQTISTISATPSVGGTTTVSQVSQNQENASTIFALIFILIVGGIFLAVMLFRSNNSGYRSSGSCR